MNAMKEGTLRKKGKAAWLVTWDTVLCDDMPIPSPEVVCLLPLQLGDAAVKQILRCLWSTLCESLGEKIGFATTRRRRDADGVLRDPLLRVDRDVDQAWNYGFF